MGYEIRRCVEDDYEMVRVFLDAHLVGDYFMTFEQIRDVVGQTRHLVWLAVEEDRMLGIAIVTKGRRTLVNLLVDPCERNRGLGGALLSACGCQGVRAKLDVMAGDPREFYFRRGWKSTGQRNRKGNIEMLMPDLDAD